MSYVDPIHTEVAGRARYRVAGLQRSKLVQQYLESRLAAEADILKVSASPTTGNLLISYNSDNTPQSIAQLVDSVMADFSPQWKDAGASSTVRFPVPEEKSHGLDAHTIARDGMISADQWHRLKREAVMGFLDTDHKKGLSLDMVGARQRQYGANLLPAAEPRSNWDIFRDQLLSLPTYLLGAAAGVSILTGGLLDAAVIMGVVAANAAIGYWTESKAEKTIHSLKKLVRPCAEVIRDGQAAAIPAEEVVVGDLLVLKPGMYVAADCRIVKAGHLNIDESMLTGESMPVHKYAKVIAKKRLPLADRRNMAYMGTLVTGGQGLAVVVATGRFTEIGQLQLMLDQTRPPETPIERQLGQMGDQLVLMCGAVCGAVFVLGFMRGYGVARMMRMAISLAAAAVPEGLPAAATINFALGVNRMRKHRVLIRHLQAVETLGAVQTICLDKTGTLTCNQMTVQQVFVGGRRIRPGDGWPMDGDSGHLGSDMKTLLAACALCNETKINGSDGDIKLYGSSTENALVRLAMDCGMDVAAFKRSLPLLKVTHRSERRLFMSTAHKMADGRKLVTLKGSPPEVLAMCRYQMVGNDTIELTEEDRLAIEMENEKMAGHALRVLGFAYKEVEADEKSNHEACLIWLGLVGMSDPIRPGVRELIEVFHRAGVETVMITGDQSSTAYAVAKDLNLSQGSPLEILDSEQLTTMTPDTLQALAKKVHVYSRVSPAHKLKIVQSLQAAGKTVAMTGDGINDGPALKAADIGIAMGRTGTDVARDVADIVLEEDHLQILAQALGDGRTIYGNIRKSVHFFLATNISEILIMIAAMGAGIGFPLNVMQLLWINIISDILPALALSLEAGEPDVMEHQPRDSKAPLFDRRDYGRMLMESGAITGGALTAYGFGIARYGLGPQAGSLAFQSLTFGQLLHALSCRSEHSGLFHGKKLPPNPHLTVSIAGSLILQAATMVFPPLRSFLGLTALGAADVAVIGGTSLLPLLLNESTKTRREN